MKTVTINVTGASQNQWSTFLLELNLMKKAWRSYGVDAELKAKSIKKIIFVFFLVRSQQDHSIGLPYLTILS